LYYGLGQSIEVEARAVLDNHFQYINISMEKFGSMEMLLSFPVPGERGKGEEGQKRIYILRESWNASTYHTYKENNSIADFLPKASQDVGWSKLFKRCCSLWFVYTNMGVEHDIKIQKQVNSHIYVFLFQYMYYLTHENTYMHAHIHAYRQMHTQSYTHI